ncbi:MAG: glucose-1-phosphate adenylyltransferase [SAR324 cluster bacterium]|nr:glucose-1-phosphate adenylyltransferase [SAR324 cluster bacterium]
MHDVAAIILAGGQGTRLYPLTKSRAKPAVPLAGKYRLIDIPLSNCINSGIDRIFVLTQFNSQSLNRHISRTYRFSMFTNSFVEVLVPQQTNERSDWFQGTSDAVRHHLHAFRAEAAQEYLILSGDHLYRMDYSLLIRHHRQSQADITLGVIPVAETQASRFGLIKIDSSGRVTDFREKPEGESLEEMKVDTTKLGLSPEEAERHPYLASMGIYSFKRNLLFELLESSTHHDDFGKQLIPSAITDVNVQTHLFNDYWEDIGTIESFYQANLKLLYRPIPPFSFYDSKKPIFSRPRFLPPTEIEDSQIHNSLVADGCSIKKATISRSIIGIRSQIANNVVIEESMLSGADFYQSPEECQKDEADGIPPIGIGENTHIRRAILDKDVRIGKNVQIINPSNIQDKNCEEKGYCIKGGIVVVMKQTVIADNTII